MTLARPWIRIAAYTLLAVGAAVATMGTALSADRIWGDEANYASCVDTMNETGQWLSPAPFPGVHYFQKPPLQMWLTAATYRAFPDIVRYRVWPVAFGLMAVALVCVIAGQLFGPEIGFIAALLLATNNRFLYEHGARTGTFDSGLTFFVLLCLTIYWRAARPGSGKLCGFAGGKLGWITIGVAAGLASLLKPLAGLPVIALLALHAITLPRDQRRRLFVGFGWAIGAMLIVTLPWYAAEGIRFGAEFSRDMFARNIVERSTAGVDPRHLHPLAYYAAVISQSAPLFALAIPGMLFALIAGVRGSRRSAWRLIAVIAIGWPLLFSLSHSKATHYVYPAFPAICICIAGLLGWLVDRVASFWKNEEFRERTLVAGYGGVILVLLITATELTSGRVNQPGRRYEPYDVYLALKPAIESHAVRFLTAGFEPGRPIWYSRPGLDATDLFYLRRMKCDQPLGATTSLSTALNSHVPTLLLAARTSAAPELDDAGRTDPRFSAQLPGFVLAGIDLTTILHPALTYTTTDFVGSVPLNASPAIAADGVLEIAATLADPAPQGVLCSLVFRGRPLEESLVSPDGTRLTFALPIDRKWLTPGPAAIELRFRPFHGSEPISGRLESARLTLTPLIPH